MKLAPEHIARIEKLFEKVAGDIYSEAPSDLHTTVTERVMGRFIEKTGLQAGARLLDVGCGQGVGLKRFAERGYQAVGITLSEADLAACQAQGFEVRAMDQSFLDFPDGSFEAVWARHCVEHSVIPYLTLHEFHRVLRPGGMLYVEVPAPDTSSRHQTNRNHYSVLGKSMWDQLRARAGFQRIEIFDINMTTQAGPDIYWGFILHRP